MLKIIKLLSIKFLIFKNMKKITLFIIFVFLVSIILFFSSQRTIFSQRVIVSPGMSARNIASVLKKEGLIKNELFFCILVKVRRVENNLQTGTYLFNNKMGTYTILNKIVKGAVESIKLTIPEGWTAQQIASLIEQESLGSREKFLKEVKEKELEGYLFPDTYFVNLGVNETQIIQMMNNKFAKVFNEKLKKRTKELKLTEKEIVILASIIEKEAKKDEERALISRVFHNRLKKGWLLESCATVQYALGEHRTMLTYEDLKVDSIYNTYIHSGLPPGPICNPGAASIKAALYPAQSDALFFVSGENGFHKFSRYYSEHIREKNSKNKKWTQ